MVTQFSSLVSYILNCIFPVLLSALTRSLLAVIDVHDTEIYRSWTSPKSTRCSQLSNTRGPQLWSIHNKVHFHIFMKSESFLHWKPILKSSVEALPVHVESFESQCVQICKYYTCLRSLWVWYLNKIHVPESSLLKMWCRDTWHTLTCQLGHHQPNCS